MAERCRFSRMRAWVTGVVWVTRQSICGLGTCDVSVLNTSGSASPGSGARPSQSMVRRSSRGGVPVLRRPSGRARRSRVRARLMEGASPTRPARVWRSPICTTPRKKVPVVRTAAAQRIRVPSAAITAERRPSSPISRSSTDAARRVKPSVSSSKHRTARRYNARSACARGPRTAGPLLRLSSLKWIPALSAARPISPSSASISRTRWPLPIPPIEGLQDISPIVSRRWVNSSVRAPMRAATAAASQPPCSGGLIAAGRLCVAARVLFSTANRAHDESDNVQKRPQAGNQTMADGGIDTRTARISAEEALAMHASGRPGKLETRISKPITTARDLSLAYSPGVAEPCLHIARNASLAYDYTTKGNMVAVISNGTAVLGLGNLGAVASKPVMEGKVALFKRFADVDGIDLEIGTEDVDEFVSAVRYLGPGFGGINLEDIKAPECFVIEQRLRELMDIPV